MEEPEKGEDMWRLLDQFNKKYPNVNHYADEEDEDLGVKMGSLDVNKAIAANIQAGTTP